jgi:hypothetical protein
MDPWPSHVDARPICSLTPIPVECNNRDCMLGRRQTLRKRRRFVRPYDMFQSGAVPDAASSAEKVGQVAKWAI